MNFLKTIYEYTENNGLVFITVPAYNFLWLNEDIDAGQYKRYTIKTISDCLIKAGFRIEYKSNLFSILPTPIFLFKSLPSLLGLNKKSDDFNKQKKENNSKNGIIQKLINYFLNKKISKIKSDKSTAFGSSCFILAKKG